MNSRKLLAGIVGSVAMLASALFPTASAHAQGLPGSSEIANNFQAPALPDFNQLVQQFDQRNRDGAWELRNQLVHQANTLNPQFGGELRTPLTKHSTLFSLAW